MASKRPFACLFSPIVFLIPFTFTHAQSISTSITIPPLQWLNLTGLLFGAIPPPLKDASIGYDETTRTLLIFGGESQGGFVQASTHLLNLDSLVWSIPAPPSTLRTTPPPRSAAIGGGDFAASNRHGHVIFGGKGSDGSALGDLWEFDYTSQFWRQVEVSTDGPTPRWGASGGIDTRTAPVQDPLAPGPNNTFYLAGGQSNSSSAISLSDVWQLSLSGILSSNLPDSVKSSWSHRPVADRLPSKFAQAGTVLGQQIVVAGGCVSPADSGPACAQQDSYVIHTQDGSSIAPGSCPAPRTGAALVPNYAPFSSNFASQTFLLLGTFDTSLWQDDQGLLQGEVAVLDVNTGSWSRVLPSGDPGTRGRPSFPSPREGAAVFSSSTGLVGSSRLGISDTIVFGGRDASGTYLSEVWVLRAYNGSVGQPNPQWQGFGDGKLQSGINANGAGVSVQFMTRCASLMRPPSTSPVPSPSSSPTPIQHSFNTSVAHKTLAPLSVALLLLATFLYRLCPQNVTSRSSKRHSVPIIGSAVVIVAAYAAGVGGLIAAFTSIKPTSGLHLSALNLRTVHGKVGLVLFIGAYGLLPILLCISSWVYQLRLARAEAQGEKSRIHGTETARSRSDYRASTPSVRSPTPNSSSPLARLQSWRRSGLWRKRHDEPRSSTDSDSVTSCPPHRGFEILNRPARGRHITSNSDAIPQAVEMSHRRFQSLGEIDWLDRRRALNEVDALDYVITETRKAQALAATQPQSLAARPELPGPYSIALRVAFHTLLLALCAFSLTELWSRAPRGAFVIFLLWSITFYLLIFLLASYGRPHVSILAVIFDRSAARLMPSKDPTPPVSTVGQPGSSDPSGPYVHHKPAYRVAVPPLDDTSTSPRSVETNDEDSHEDEQQRIEDEIGRREVSIVTVPRRKLWITNPS